MFGTVFAFSEYKLKIKGNMEKMNVYLLTKSDTAKGVGEVETKGYATYKEAYAGMVKSVCKHLDVEVENLIDLFTTYGRDFDCGETYAAIKQGNPCYWQIHSIGIKDVLVPLLVDNCFKNRGVKEPHRRILETLATEVSDLEKNKERLDNVVSDIVQDSLLGEVIYPHAFYAITPKQSYAIDDAIEQYLNYELSTDKDGTWFDKILSICAGDVKAVSRARRKIDEKLPIGGKLSDFDVTVKLTLPKSMLEKMLSTGKVSMNYE